MSQLNSIFIIIFAAFFLRENLSFLTSVNMSCEKLVPQFLLKVPVSLHPKFFILLNDEIIWIFVQSETNKYQQYMII